MSTILFFDTETTGIVNFKLPSDHPSQPNLVQLAAELHDAEKNIRGSINLIIKPEGWEIPVEASNVHGITTEHAHKYGVRLFDALAMFESLVGVADLVVAHNINFDKTVIRAANARKNVVSSLGAKPDYCTMQAATNIVKIPGKYGFKWPQLAEAHRYFTGEDFDGAHDALVDVKACARVFYYLPRAEKLAG